MVKTLCVDKATATVIVWKVVQVTATVIILDVVQVTARRLSTSNI